MRRVSSCQTHGPDMYSGSTREFMTRSYADRYVITDSTFPASGLTSRSSPGSAIALSTSSDNFLSSEPYRPLSDYDHRANATPCNLLSDQHLAAGPLRADGAGSFAPFEPGPILKVLAASPHVHPCAVLCCALLCFAWLSLKNESSDYASRLILRPKRP